MPNTTAKQWAVSLSQMSGSRTEADMPSCNRVSLALGGANQWALAQQLFATAARGLQLTAISYSIAMQIHGQRLHGWPHALSVSDSQHWSGVQRNVIHVGVLAAAISTSWYRVLVLLATLRLQALRLSTILAGSALASMASQGSWRQAFSFYQGCRTLKLETNVIFANTLLSGTGTQWLHALGIRSRLQQRSLVTHSASISCCDAASKWTQACLLLEDASRSRCGVGVAVMTAWQRAVQQLLRLQARGLVHNAIPVSTVVSASEKASCWEVAFSLLHGCQCAAIELDIVLCSACISACEKGKQWQRSMWLFAGLGSFKLKANSITFGAAISALEVCEQWQRSLCLLATMKSRSLRATIVTYNAAVKACERATKWNEALQLLGLAQGESLLPNLITYNAALAACSRRSKWDEALKLYLEVCDKGLDPDSVAYAAAISALAEISLQYHVPPLLSKLDALGFLRCKSTRRYSGSTTGEMPEP